MIKSALVMSNKGTSFNDINEALGRLRKDVGELLADANKIILELEYEGVIIHSYNSFDSKTQQLTQVFATSDLTMLDQRLYTNEYVSKALESAVSKGWEIKVAVL